jgi:hypothetical protein
VTRHAPKLSMAVLLMGAGLCHAQSLTPRAYIITPVHSNAITMSYSFSDGSTLFDPNIPITDAKAKFSVPVISYYHTLNSFGRSANIAAIDHGPALQVRVGQILGSMCGSFVACGWRIQGD